MKNNYKKVIREVIKIKEKVYEDFKKSGSKNFCEFIKNDVKDIRDCLQFDVKRQ